MEKYCRAGQATDDDMVRIARWIPKATNRHSEYVIFIAFPLQLWLHKRASILCYTYVGNSISKLQIQVMTYVFELSAGNCHR